MSPTGGFLRRMLLLPPQASTIASEVDHLHFAVILATMGGAFVLTLVAAVFTFKYRERRPRTRSEGRPLAPMPPLWAEAAIICGLFLLFVGFWGIGFSQYVGMAEAPPGSFDIYVTAKQWMWKFSYPNGTHSIDDLFVPAGKPVRLILTSRDVIHSFYVPDFRLKQDAVPGRYTTLWFTAKLPGTSQVLCAEYCGTRHSEMRGRVIALDAGSFSRWLGQAGTRPEIEPSEREGPGPAASLSVRGQEVATRYGCLRCHTVDGTPHIGPSWAGLYEATIPLTNGSRVKADVPYLTESMMDPAAKIHVGFAPVMPSYLGYLGPSEVSALIEYIQSLAGAAAEQNAPGERPMPLPRGSATQPEPTLPVTTAKGPPPPDGGTP
jgi:cytochrome c oxidase subunit 2